MKSLIILLVSLVSVLSNSIFAQTGYESYFLWYGEFPTKATTDWFPNETEMQGVANDDHNWYFTCTNLCLACNTDGYGQIWKIPASIPLNTPNIIGLPGVEKLYYPNLNVLSDLQYSHFGDADYHEYKGVGYLVVPLTGGKTGIPAVAFFKTNPLSFVNYALLDSIRQGGDNAGWCAVKKNGDIITSPDATAFFNRYSLDWSTVVSNPGTPVKINYEGQYDLVDANGNGLFLHDMQGGDFSPSEEILYVSCGTGECLGGGHGTFDTDGIWAMNTTKSNWEAITHSTNRQRGETGNFSFDFDNGCNACGLFFGGAYAWFPEGLTVWDLDDHSAPNISGQLHVTSTRWAKFSLCDDEFSFQHYSNKIWIDNDAPALNTNWEYPLPGLPENPFKSLEEAYTYYPVWDGAEMIIKSGVYNDTGTYSKRIQIKNIGGTVTIGGQ